MRDLAGEHTGTLYCAADTSEVFALGEGDAAMKRLVVFLADELYDPLEREAHKRGTTLTEMVSTYLRREFPRVYFEYVWERCKAYHARPSSSSPGGASGSKPI